MRKDFSPRKTGITDYETELHKLSILNHLKHPNIIELLSAYTYRRVHNLVFPLARGGDLATLFQGERPPAFEHNEAFTISLSNLASAIEEVHNFTSNKLNLELIGCHHDLKPKNILIDGSIMLLADFGLSRFKDRLQSSETPFKLGRGDCLAPEYEDLDDDNLEHTVRRSSDIWSFGCIIAEVVTYILHGPTGVSIFREKREYKSGHYRFHRFHCGSKQPSSSVAIWLSDLDRLSSRMELHSSNCLGECSR